MWKAAMKTAGINELHALVAEALSKADAHKLADAIVRATELAQDEARPVTRDYLDARFAAAASDLQKALTDWRAELQQQIAGLRAELQQQILGVRAELQQQIAEVRTELQQQIADVRSDLIDNMRTQQMWTVGTFVLLLVSVVLQHFWK
jgi:polyhydroxyalkanoate synthesis regulator phasin